MPGQFESILDKLQRKLGKQTIRKASSVARPKPRPDVIQMQAINDFVRRNPRANGGKVETKLGKGIIQKNFKDKNAIKIFASYDLDPATKEITFGDRTMIATSWIVMMTRLD